MSGRGSAAWDFLVRPVEEMVIILVLVEGSVERVLSKHFVTRLGGSITKPLVSLNFGVGKPSWARIVVSWERLALDRKRTADRL